MLTNDLQFELEYNPATKKLTLIDYKMKGLRNPFKMIYGSIETAEQIGKTVEAWVKLKETQNKT